MHDKYWMSLAFKLAKSAYALGEVPVGAVIVDKDDNLIGEGFNQVITGCSPTLHAEMIAISESSKRLHNYRLDDSTMYVTLEPCCMCAGAIVHARIARLVFATRDFNTGATGSVYNILQGYPQNHKVQIDEGIMQEESAQLLTDFFLKRRS